MAEAKKRFPWRLLVCAVVLVILAAVLGFVETVGRKGTIVGKYERIREGMSTTDVVRILGRATIFSPQGKSIHGAEGEGVGEDERLLVADEGPVMVWVLFDPEKNRVREKSIVTSNPEREVFVSWHIRRWAEQAYTAIHGPRR